MFFAKEAADLKKLRFKVRFAGKDHGFKFSAKADYSEGVKLLSEKRIFRRFPYNLRESDSEHG